MHIRSEEGVHKNTKADARINESTPQIPAKRNAKFHTISEHEKKKSAKRRRRHGTWAWRVHLD